MNRWLKLSLEYASQKSYLDDLFRVYPTIPEGIRDVDFSIWKQVELAYREKNNEVLISLLLKLDLFPIKDSYVAYLKRDKTALSRNPLTVDRLCGRLYEMGLTEIYKRTSEPKETNRQIGPMFKTWLKGKTLGIEPVSLHQFTSNQDNAILDASDVVMADFARHELDYRTDKGLDFIGRFNGKYVIGEAKFLTDFGGHQNSQFNDAIRLLNSSAKAIKIAILDGVIYIKSANKMYKTITETLNSRDIMSALVLREFLYSL